MSLTSARMPSLADKLEEQERLAAASVEVPEEEKGRIIKKKKK